MTDLKIAMLRKCREQFEFYARNHRTKAETIRRDVKAGGVYPSSADAAMLRQAADTENKAAVNERMVAEIDEVLGADDPAVTST